MNTFHGWFPVTVATLQSETTKNTHTIQGEAAVSMELSAVIVKPTLLSSFSLVKQPGN